MLVTSLMTLGVASIATVLSINCKEEIIRVSAASVAVLAGVLALIFAPWELKLLAIAIPLGLDKFRA